MKPSQITRVKDIFTKNPKMIRKFMDTDSSVNSLFVESKAKGAYAFRNMMNNAMYAKTHAMSFMRSQDVKPTKEQVTVLKNVIKNLQQVIDAVGDGVEGEV